MYRLARGEPEAWTLQQKTEIEKQLDFNKSFPAVNGTVYFSAKSFFKNPFEINEVLKRNYYTNPLLPPSTNHDKKFIPEPVFEVKFTKLKKENINYHGSLFLKTKKKKLLNI